MAEVNLWLAQLVKAIWEPQFLAVMCSSPSAVPASTFAFGAVVTHRRTESAGTHRHGRWKPLAVHGLEQ
jgi:hypothetical protein